MAGARNDAFVCLNAPFSLCRIETVIARNVQNLQSVQNTAKANNTAVTVQ